MSGLSKEEQLEALKYKGTEWDKEFYRHNVYSDKAINKYLDDIGIESKEGREKMADSILSAAMYYEVAKRSHLQSYAPSGEVERSIKSIASPLKTLIKHFEKMNTLGHESITRAYRARASSTEINEKESMFIDALFPHGLNGALINPAGFLAFLKSYEASCEAALKDGVGFNVAKKGYALKTWLQNLGHNWDEYGSILFVEGKKQGEFGYINDAIEILLDIMYPLDASVEGKTIAYALREINTEAKK